MFTSPYDAARTYFIKPSVAEAAVGRRATLPFTGEIIEVGESDAGTWAKFKVDERWGYGPRIFTLDLAALEVEAPEPPLEELREMGFVGEAGA